MNEMAKKIDSTPGENLAKQIIERMYRKSKKRCWLYTLEITKLFGICLNFHRNDYYLLTI